ncbi:conserved hypothetical protein [Rhodopseudomonas palustris BisB5]|uniref:Alpha/beta hydrolase n=1 Tax=Rhodopseudomonas palustris (strain BisB5) TaxID=316057 RepID=Q13EC6_RHOPS|nr:conserved hypothetical protein [Rhodopseudomonas palustris BisB5]
MLGGLPDWHRLDPSAEPEAIRRCLESFDPPVEAVAIPWREDLFLDSYYLPFERSGTDRAPIAVCIGEMRSKEELLIVMARPARERRLALLCVDSGSDDVEAPRRSVRPESCVTAVIDYLVELPGIDPNRIALIADGSPSSLIAKGVVMDGRVAAAVCDGGLWELWEHAQTASLPGYLGAIAPTPIVAAIRCPTLIPLLPGSGIDPVYAKDLLSSHQARDRRIAIADLAPQQSEMAPADSRIWAETTLNWVSRQLDGIQKIAER